MTHHLAAPILRHIRRLATSDALTDGECLDCFAKCGDEAAFAMLVRRHGPMVFRVCRAVLADVHAAEDAFQATFLILARQASAVRKQPSLGSWLYKVAYRIALRARDKDGERLRREAAVWRRPAVDPLDEISWREVQAIFFDELSKLAECYRTPLLLCCFEGKTRDEAAKQLGCGTGTLKSQLERGRKLLRIRLARRGLTLSAGLLASQLARAGVDHAVPSTLADATVRASVAWMAGEGITELAGERALRWSRTASGTTAARKLVLGALLMIGTLAAAGFGMTLYQLPEPDRPAPGATSADADKSPAPIAAKEGADIEGNPLPREAISRLGTLQLRHGTEASVGAGNVRFTPDGKRLVTVGAFEGVRTWDVATGKKLHDFPLHLPQLYTTSADGRLLAKSDKTGIEILDLDTRKVVFKIEGAYSWPVDFSPDRKLIVAAIASVPSRLEMWEVESGRRLWSWDSGSKFVPTSVAFTFDRKSIIVAGKGPISGQGTILFLNGATGVEERRFDPGIRAHDPILLQLSPGGTRLAAVCIDGRWRRIHVWDTASGKELFEFDPPESRFAPGWHFFTVFAFAPDGKSLLASGSCEGLRELDLATGKMQRLGHGMWGAHGLVFSPDGKTVAVANENPSIQLIDRVTGEDRSPGIGHHGRIAATAITPDGRTAVTAGNAPAFCLWDLKTGKAKGHFEAPDTDYPGLATDGSTASSLEYPAKILHVFDLPSGKERCQLSLDFLKSNLVSFDFSPRGKVLAEAGISDNTIYLIDTVAGKISDTLKDAALSVNDVTFAKEGRVLFVISTDSTVQVWDVAKKSKMRQFGPLRSRGPKDSGLPLLAWAVSPDGNWIAAADTTGSVSLFDSARGMQAWKLDGANCEGGCLAFSTDSRMLAWHGGWIGADKPAPMTHLVEVASGKERHVFASHRGYVNSFAFSPDGKALLAAYQDTTALAWDLTGRAALRDRPLASAEISACWAAVASDDAARAHAAMQKLIASPIAALTFPKEWFRFAPPADEKVVVRLIADLDSDRFEVREKAASALDELGDTALSACQKALAGQPSAEVRRRLEAIVEKRTQEWRVPSADKLRALRVVEVLERTGTPEARRLLEKVANGIPEVRLAREAKASLERIAKRPSGH